LPLLAAALLLSVGCTPPASIGQRQERVRYAQLDYPAQAEYGPDLDIVVRREGKQIALINRTADRYTDARVWLNQQFVRDLARVEIGPDNRFDLSRWTNQHREPFPVGTLLAPDTAEPVVLAELLDPATGLRHRLTVWPDETER
jgi:hypothetical protein